MRFYAAWLARFISVDPLQFEYPYYTPFQYAGNMPISYIDLDGAEPLKHLEIDLSTGDVKLNIVTDVYVVRISNKYRFKLKPKQSKRVKSYFSKSTDFAKEKLDFNGGLTTRNNVEFIYNMNEYIIPDDEYENEKTFENRIANEFGVKLLWGTDRASGENFYRTFVPLTVFETFLTNARGNQRDDGSALRIDPNYLNDDIAWQHELGHYMLWKAGSKEHAEGGLMKKNNTDTPLTQSNLDAIIEDTWWDENSPIRLKNGTWG